VSAWRSFVRRLPNEMMEIPVYKAFNPEGDKEIEFATFFAACGHYGTEIFKLPCKVSYGKFTRNVLNGFFHVYAPDLDDGKGLAKAWVSVPSPRCGNCGREFWDLTNMVLLTTYAQARAAKDAGEKYVPIPQFASEEFEQEFFAAHPEYGGNDV
jgi:hypothetical protein